MAVAKKAATKKAAAKKAAAKKAATGTVATEARATAESAFSVGDVVVATGVGSATGAGRICRVLNFDRYCVHFADVGCRRVPGSSLSLAPSGVGAPDCTGCVDC